MMRPPHLLTFLAMLLLAGGGQAAPITFDFTGTATGVGGIANGIWAGQGTDVIGSFSYDTDLIASVGNATLNKFQSNIATNAGNGWSISFTLGGVTRTLDSSSAPFTLILYDKATDSYSFGAANASLTLHGSDPAAVEELDGSAPDAAPDLSLFGLAKGLYKLEGSANQLSFNLTSITLAGASAPMPEPSAALLFGLGAVAVGRATRKTRVA